MNRILFIGAYESPLSQERYKIIKENIRHEKIFFFNTSFTSFFSKDLINTKFILNKYLTNILQFFYLLFIIYKYKINILHFHGGFQVFLNFLSLFIYKKIRIIVTVQGSEINQNYKGYKKYFVKFLLKNSNYITVKSTFMKKRVKNIILNNKNIIDLNWGVDDNLFSFVKKDCNQKINIISFRATGLIYNIDKIFDAILNLKKKYNNIYFTYVEFNKNHNIKLDLSIVDEHYKNLSKDELFNVLREQDIMISIPSCDGFSTSLMESLALGVYPIISDIESYNDDELKKYVEVIDLYNERDFIEKLEYCISSIDKIREDMEKRISFAKKNYSRKNQIKNLREIYKS
ncbi:glycosyltransferase [Aliarcobacter butzleri]|uniref:glycosyltransferase n=1 Tax=Aliarcobacter butzleri TaxID=28197 RepID=UPI00263CE338|nr:glycosyltransferase [Aliarcobacter butzleri]MDN5081919.1 glycosyltransferase [Aliarcobacter butzleri]MDN5084229.1 glycosyltransferase [Aliarcobacter butzleri]